MSDKKLDTLSLWLRERQKDLDGYTNAKPKMTYDKNICQGQVRVLSNEGLHRAILVLILKEWDKDDKENQWLITPLSPYSLPAFSGELLIGSKVFQVWNSRTVSYEQLKGSSTIDDVSQSTLDDVWDLFRGLFIGEVTQSSEVGLPIMSEDINRIVYQQEEYELLNKLFPF